MESWRVRDPEGDIWVLKSSDPFKVENQLRKFLEGYGGKFSKITFRDNSPGSFRKILGGGIGFPAAGLPKSQDNFSLHF